MAIVPNERAAPASTQSTGTNQRLDLRWMNNLVRLIASWTPYPSQRAAELRERRDRQSPGHPELRVLAIEEMGTSLHFLRVRLGPTALETGKPGGGLRCGGPPPADIFPC